MNRGHAGSPSALTAVLTDALAKWEDGEDGMVVGEATPGGVWDAMQATLEQWGVPQPIAVVEVGARGVLSVSQRDASGVGVDCQSCMCRLLIQPSSPCPQLALLDAQLGVLDNPSGGPLTFAEHPRPYLVLSGAPPPPPGAASVSSGSSAVEDANGEHLVGQVWVSGPLGKAPPGVSQRAVLVVYPRQQVMVLATHNCLILLTTAC